VTTDAELDPARPFLDQALLDQRAEQRRLVASIPNALVPRLRILDDVRDRPAWPERLERWLRDLAAPILAELSPALEQGAEANLAEAAFEFLDSIDRKVRPNALVKAWDSARRAKDRLPDRSTPEEQARIADVIALTDLADWLADDGYRDPRRSAP
jgi:hypothetical protein